MGRSVEREVDREEREGRGEEYRERGEVGRVKGDREREEERDKRGYGGCGWKDGGI